MADATGYIFLLISPTLQLAYPMRKLINGYCIRYIVYSYGVIPFGHLKLEGFSDLLSVSFLGDGRTIDGSRPLIMET